ncbi:MAG TPA: AAA family ATPase [Methanothrix sp.]|nr:AAA family ATPase [Methanothrix sp.]
MPNYYQNDAEYLMDELNRLDVMLTQLISRKGQGSADDPLKGLYITEREADALLGGKEAGDEGQQSPQSGLDRHTQVSRDEAVKDAEKVRAAESDIRKKVKRSLEAGSNLRLCRLERIFTLDQLEHDTVIICAAAELDTKYEKIYGYLQDDMTRRSPTLGLVLDLLCSTPEEKVEARKRFLPGAKMLREGIIEPADGREESLQLSSALRLNSNVLASLIGADASQRWRQSGGLSKPVELSSKIPDDVQATLKNLIIHLAKEKGRALCHIQGPYGARKREMAGQICAALGKKMVRVDLMALEADEKGFEAVIIGTLRSALLEGLAVCIETLDLLAAEDPKYQSTKSWLARALDEHSGLVILSSQGPVDLGRELQGKILPIMVPVPDYPERRKMWARALDGRLPQEDLDDLASKFRFTGGQIEDAVQAARNLAALEGRSDLEREDIYRGCRVQSNRRLSSLSKRVAATCQWKDIVLPDEKLEQLKDIVRWVKHKGEVYHDWGFGKKLALGKGLNILFSGTSGTGKTLAASVLASELGLEMYKVDLSTVVSKYIGETEKNLSKIFQEAEQGNAILFFDEADAIFGKRSEVKDAHDRYANMEIGYLLQKMEEHEGIVVLATNLGKNMDEAFTRRMHFIVEFPFPEEEYRLAIWKTLLPAEAPVAEDVNFEFLARKLQVPGGNIKNILVGAAFLAAENGGTITMEHVIKSAWKEYRKVGMVCSQSDFGKYYPLVSS